MSNIAWTVIVVDDNKVDRTLTGRILENLDTYGIRVFIKFFDTGESALEYLSEHAGITKPAKRGKKKIVIFCDKQMPRMGGFELALRLEEISPKDYSFNILTGTPTEDDLKVPEKSAFIKGVFTKTLTVKDALNAFKMAA